eukprot:g150.t1
MDFYPVARTSNDPVLDVSQDEDIINLVSSDDDSGLSNKRYSQLRQEILNFAIDRLTTPKKSYAIDQVIKRINTVSKELFQNSQVQLFGSQATGLASPSSDLDVVILDNGPGILAPKESFTNQERNEIIVKLKQLDTALQKYTIQKGKLIPAKIPILRIQIQISRAFCFNVDVSFGLKNAALAVELIQKQLFANPVIQPLFLIVKTLLKKHRLNEVYSGGVSSFVIFNLVVAHLMMEGVHSNPVSDDDSKSTLSRRYHVHWLRQMLVELDLPLDVLLLRFFQRFGDWNQKLAVSILHHGVIPVSTIEDAIPGRILHVEDPQASGKDATRGTFDMPKVLLTFQNAADQLEEKLQQSESQEGILESIISVKSTINEDTSQGNSKRNREVTGDRKKRRRSKRRR